MAYADKIGVPFAVLIGEDEMNAGVLSVKDMRSGEQVIITRKYVPALKRALKGDFGA